MVFTAVKKYRLNTAKATETRCAFILHCSGNSLQTLNSGVPEPTPGICARTGGVWGMHHGEKMFNEWSRCNLDGIW